MARLDSVIPSGADRPWRDAQSRELRFLPCIKTNRRFLGSVAAATSLEMTDFSMSGEQITALDGQGNWKRSNGYAAGAPLATYDANGLHFNLSDALGTKRVQVNATGVVEESCQSLPFGDQLNCIGADDNKLHFTTKERDTESGNDYFGARYLSSNAGRFLSPDWSKNPQGVPYADYSNPQSLNLYAYVGNNPLARADADGHNWWNKLVNLLVGDAQCWCEGAQAEAAAKRNRAKLAEQDRQFWKSMRDPRAQVFVTMTFMLAGAEGDAAATADAAAGEADAAAAEGVGAAEGNAISTASESGAVDANKLSHIFGNSQHDLAGIVSKFGSQQAAFEAIQQATQATVEQQSITGVFETTVQVSGDDNGTWQRG